MRPRWKKIEKEHPDLQTEYVDFDENKQLVDQYKLDSSKLPCFIFLDSKGNELTRLTGEVEERKLAEAIELYKNK
jgi:hypothetical protein